MDNTMSELFARRWRFHEGPFITIYSVINVGMPGLKNVGRNIEF